MNVRNNPRPAPKSPALAAILGFTFGAFGLFYVSPNVAVGMLFFKIIGAVATAGIAAPILWLSCGFIGYACAGAHNEKYGYR